MRLRLIGCCPEPQPQALEGPHVKAEGEGMGGGEDAIKLANEQAGPQSPPKHQGVGGGPLKRRWLWRQFPFVIHTRSLKYESTPYHCLPYTIC